MPDEQPLETVLYFGCAEYANLRRSLNSLFDFAHVLPEEMPSLSRLAKQLPKLDEGGEVCVVVKDDATGGSA